MQISEEVALSLRTAPTRTGQGSVRAQPLSYSSFMSTITSLKYNLDSFPPLKDILDTISSIHPF